MLELVSVVFIVAAVAFLAGRSAYRTLTGKSRGCGCAGGSDCSGCGAPGFGGSGPGKGACG